MNFEFYTDLLKAEKTSDGLFIEGVASTTGVDKQNESMSVAALNSMVACKSLIPLVTSHQAEARDTIGEVVSHSIDDQGRYVIKARLEESDHEAIKMFNLINKGHKMGFSVGGRILSSKPSLNKAVKRVIDAVELDHIMLTRRPVNADTYASAFKKALDNMNEDIEKAGAKHSADTVTALKGIHDAGSDEIKGMVRSMLGDDAEKALGPAESTHPVQDAPKDATVAVEDIDEGSHIDAGDGDDEGANVGVACNKPVANKSLSADEIDLIKAEIIKTLKDELAKAMKPEPKVAETLDKAEEPIGTGVNSLSEAIRKSLGG